MAAVLRDSDVREVVTFLFGNRLNSVAYEDFKKRLNGALKGKVDRVVLNSTNKRFDGWLEDNGLKTSNEVIVWKMGSRSYSITQYPSSIFRDAFRILFRDLKDEDFFQTFERNARNDLLDPGKHSFLVTGKEDWIPYDIGSKKINITSYGVLKYCRGKFNSNFEPVVFKGDKLMRVDTALGMSLGEMEY